MRFGLKSHEVESEYHEVEAEYHERSEWYSASTEWYSDSTEGDFNKSNRGTEAQGHEGDLTSKLNEGRLRPLAAPARVQFGCQISRVALSRGPEVDFVEIKQGVRSKSFD